MGESGERWAAEPDCLALELGREKRRKQMLEISIFELRNTVAALEKRLNCVEDEGNEWKTRYETQVELNKQLERQINILRDKVDLIRGKPADKLSVVRTFDQMPVYSLKQSNYTSRSTPGDITSEIISGPEAGLHQSSTFLIPTKYGIASSPVMGSLKKVLKQLEKEKNSLQNQLKDYKLRLEQEAKAYHKTNDKRRMYLSEILQTSPRLKTVERQQPDALIGKGEKQILRGRYSVPGNPKMVNPQKRSIKKAVRVNQLPQLKH